MAIDDPGKEQALNPQRYQPSDPRTREEVGGILERAFQREGGREPDDVEETHFRVLAQEAEARLHSAEHLAEEAEGAAKRAAEQYALSQNHEDLEITRRWQQEAALRRREVHTLQEEVERLRKFAPSEREG
jgi:hypothetical protein